MLVRGLTLAALTLLAGGCGASSGASGPTRVRVDVVSALLAASSRTISCDHVADGRHATAAICAAIRTHPRLLRAVAGREHSCLAGTPIVFVNGSSGGRHVAVSFSACVGGQEELAARWLSLLGYSGARSVLCSTRTLRDIASQSGISPVERASAEQALSGISQLRRQGLHCRTLPRMRSASAYGGSRRATGVASQRRSSPSRMETINGPDRYQAKAVGKGRGNS